MTYTLACKGCGHAFTASRPQAETCSAACRKRAYRANLAAREAESLARLEDVLRRLSHITQKESTQP